MSVICPSITAIDAKAYREQMARVAPFATRVHIDFSDGVLAPIKLINPAQAYWPDGMVADLHLMYTHPTEQLETVVSLKPSLVIVHAEAEGDVLGMLRQLRAVNIKTGVALLQKTDPHAAADVITEADHVLIFSGTLGQFGGTADLDLLGKIGKIHAINPEAEIGWDGGVNADNASNLTLGGVDVLVAGGAIHKAVDPAAAYADLVKVVRAVE